MSSLSPPLFSLDSSSSGVPKSWQAHTPPSSLHGLESGVASTLPLASPVIGTAQRFSFRRKTPLNPITIFPQPRQFAVVQMDPVAMLTSSGLDDPEAVAAVNGLVMKKHLVYLDTALDLPMPQSKWCTYRVKPIASTLRAECPDWGVTPDMVLPIPPNAAHLKVPDPFVDSKDPDYVFKFPFKNCFFWAESDTELRVRVRHGDHQFDNRKAISLPLRPHLRVTSSFTPDIATISEFLSRPRDKPARHPPAAATDGIPSRPPQPHFDALNGRLPTLLETDNMLGGVPGGDVCDSNPAEANSASDSDSLSPSPLEELLSLNLFGWLPDPATKYVPLVNCWLELEEHLDESTIASPVELWTEQQRIGAIINGAIERRNAARTAIKSRPAILPVEITNSLSTNSSNKSRRLRKVLSIFATRFNTLIKAFKQRERTGSGPR